VRIYSLQEDEHQFGDAEANQIFKAGWHYQGSGGWNWCFRVLPSLVSYWIKCDLRSKNYLKTILAGKPTNGTSRVDCIQDLHTKITKLG
jgi:hypothetical protein